MKAQKLYRGSTAPTVQAELCVTGAADPGQISDTLMLEPTKTADRLWVFSTGEFRSNSANEALKALSGLIPPANCASFKALALRSGLHARTVLSIAVKDGWYPEGTISKESLAFLCGTGSDLILNVRYIGGSDDLSGAGARCTFTLRGKELDLAAVTEALRYEPTSARKKEDFPLPVIQSGRAQNTWTHAGKILPFAEFTEDCSLLAGKLKNVKSALTDLLRCGNAAFLDFSFYTDGRSFSDFLFDRDLTELAHDLGIGIDFGFYAPD